MRKVYKKRDEDAVSPVIATILMVAITVVLAAVLYVMVIGMSTGPEGIDTPLGLNAVSGSKTLTNITIQVANAPSGAKLQGMVISMTRGGSVQQITEATIYSAEGLPLLVYTPGTIVTLETVITAGMKIVVETPAISSGDVISITSTENYFGASSLNVP
ncbi:MAG: type IV pilin [Candidatus Thermoplasmatota archaeon]|nr:type IV pilin [Euryarchaeota archaeon]MBU4033063.1 type IV pilin [Candidatus Thermoplasmatota archaeon]MBU4072157.1 type IV pilin [Candidatus Thermoplasmatota archaeon]MBU4144636.1 type IV pilin [Candidatus Thermoplasmatota archaeon]MBU4592737.1 type IV pilin [Candidatus Thermoplasmatota archaeon]